MKEFVKFEEVINYMNNTCCLMISLYLLCLSFVGSLVADEPLTEVLHWNQWRGPNMDGIHPHADPPVNWSEQGKGSNNVKWKTEVPGQGHSSPVIWKDHMFYPAKVTKVEIEGNNSLDLYIND